jgi:hypothetical protein
MFRLRLSKRTKDAFKFIKELPKRYKALQARIPFVVAQGVHAGLLERIPEKDEWSSYRNGLEVVGVASKNKGFYAIRLQANGRGGSAQVDPPRTLIYIRPHRRLSKVPPMIQILSQYSPWTADTLPFMPSKRDAIVVSRRSTKQVTARVASQRKRDRPFWSKEMVKAGRKETKKSNRVKPSIAAKPATDYAYQALRLEFGLGIRAVPHWRPSIRPFIRNPLRAIMARDPQLAEYLSPKFRGWKSWRSKVKNTISKAEAAKFVPFQQRLGL